MSRVKSSGPLLTFLYYMYKKTKQICVNIQEAIIEFACCLLDERRALFRELK